MLDVLRCYMNITSHRPGIHYRGAELNGFDFNCRVLKPWARDPAFYQSVWTYQSDTPAHEGPTHHALVELWTYDFPLSAAEERASAQAEIPLDRIGRPEEFGDLVAFLCSERASYLHGVALPLDGGVTRGLL